MDNATYRALLKSEPLLRESDKLIDEMFNRMANDDTRLWSDVARDAKVSMSTVRNLRDGITKLPRALTLIKLARSIGMNFSLVSSVSTIRIHKPKRKSA